MLPQKTFTEILHITDLMNLFPTSATAKQTIPKLTGLKQRLFYFTSSVCGHEFRQADSSILQVVIR